MWWIILALAVLAVALYVLRRVLQYRHEREAALIRRVRTTTLYRRLLPLIRHYEGRCVEQIIIRREEVTLSLYRPMRTKIRFNYAAHGLDVVDRPDTLQALARALAVDAPSLDDRNKYWFVRRSAARDLGEPDVWYEYNVQPAYRDTMLRASYDRPEPEEGIVR